MGFAFLARGTQKVLDWYGANSTTLTMGSAFGSFAHTATWLALIGMLIEFVGGIALILGLLTRVAAIAITVQTILTSYFAHFAPEVFRGWTSITGDAVGFRILTIALGLLLVVRGGGAWSLDRRMDRGTTLPRRPPRESETVRAA
jgi:putative oxidoreductase